MIKLNTIKKEPYEIISDVIQMEVDKVKTLLSTGFEFDYESLHFYGNLEIGKEIYHLTVYKHTDYIHLNIINSKEERIDCYTINREDGRCIRDIRIQPILSYILIFTKKMEDKAKKSFSEYVQSEKA